VPCPSVVKDIEKSLDEGISDKYNALLEANERKVKIQPGLEWTDTGIVIERNQQLLVESDDEFKVKTDDAEASFDSIGPSEGPWVVAFTNKILGPKEDGTLKLQSGKYVKKPIIVRVEKDFGSLLALLPADSCGY